jgi:hypothetical protein
MIFKAKRYIKFVYKVGEQFAIEELVCKKVDHNYEVSNIPFYISNIALGDIISVEKDINGIWFNETVQTSEASVVQLIVLSSDAVDEIGDVFAQLGCQWESTKNRLGISINPFQDYKRIKEVLEEGLASGSWNYREACLSDTHRLQIT